jgi:large subunit ribosomal protein L24
MRELRTKSFHIKRGDTVLITAGEERGKTGKVLKVIRKKEGAIIERMNFVKRHVRPGHPTAPQGGVIEKEAPVKISI